MPFTYICLITLACFTAVSGGMSTCVASQDGSTISEEVISTSKQREDLPSHPPVIRSIVVRALSPITIQVVKGRVLITRHGLGQFDATIGMTIKPGDLVEVTSGSTMTVMATDGTLTLEADHQRRWYTFTED